MSESGITYVFISPEATNLEIGDYKFNNRVCKLESKEEADKLSALLAQCSGPLVANIVRMVQEESAAPLDALTMIAAQRALNANISADTGAVPVKADGTSTVLPTPAPTTLQGALTTGSVNDKR